MNQQLADFITDVDLLPSPESPSLTIELAAVGDTAARRNPFRDPGQAECARAAPFADAPCRSSIGAPFWERPWQNHFELSDTGPFRTPSALIR